MPTDVTGLEPSTPVRIRDTSATERASFRRCRRSWFLTVVHRLTSVEGNTNLWLGTLVHAGLESYYAGLYKRRWRKSHPHAQRRVVHDAAAAAALDAFEAEYESSTAPLAEALGFLWAGVEPTYRELGELGFDMLTAYLEREMLDPVYDEIVDVERRVLVAIRSANGRKIGELSVKTDLVGRRDGVLGVTDHKTASRETGATQLDLDDQLTAEVYAVWKDRGEFPEEATYNVLFKRVPRPPKTLKKVVKGVAQLSRDKDQQTTYDLYRAEIARLGLDPTEYADMLDYLRERDLSGESQFFRRDRVLRSPAQMASFEANLYFEWADMRRVASHPEQAYPNPSPFSCPSCPVRLVCLTMQDDGDVEAVIRASYVVGDPRR